MTTEKTRVDYVGLEELKRWPRNAKRHRLDHLDESFRRFGFVMPMLVDENTGRLVAGHGRLEGLQSRKQGGKAPPDRVEDRGDDWYVPVIRGVRFRNETEAEAYLLADNRLVELGGWDNAELIASLQQIQTSDDGLGGVGWTDGEVDELIKKAGDDLLGDGGDLAPDQSDQLKTDFVVLVECENESHQLKTIDDLLRQGYQCKALT